MVICCLCGCNPDPRESDAELVVGSDCLCLFSACFSECRSEPFCPRDAEAPCALQCVLSHPLLISLYVCWGVGWVKRTYVHFPLTIKAEAQSGGVPHEIIHRGGSESKRPPNFCCAVLWVLSLVALIYGDERAWFP